jgi:hypothetical protein
MGISKRIIGPKVQIWVCHVTFCHVVNEYLNY